MFNNNGMRFSPVGERWSPRYASSGWYNSNPFLARYKIVDGGAWNIHTGVDLQLPNNKDKGEKILATATGVVTFARDARKYLGRPTTWGNVVVIRHTEGQFVYHSRYAHLHTIMVKEGQSVVAGQQIGVLGKTGMEFAWNGEHLHFDISTSGILENNPLYWPGDNSAAVKNNFRDPYLFIFGVTDDGKEGISELVVTAIPSLRIRSTPSLSAKIIGSFPTRARFKGWIPVSGLRNTEWVRLAEQPGYVSATYVALPSDIPTPIHKLGLGVNIDLNNPVGKPRPSEVRPLKYVRLPYATQNGDVEAANGRYSDKINEYIGAGITPIIVLNHQTWGEGQGFDWNNMAVGDWERFIPAFVEATLRVAAHYKEKVIYQIWNEGDQLSEAAVGVRPDTYAEILDASVQAIRRVAPSASILSQGHVSGDPTYWQNVKRYSTSADTLTGVAVHPYGIGGGIYGRNGTVADLVWAWKRITRLPLWFTEFGVCGSGVSGLTDESIAPYITSFVSQAETQHAGRTGNGGVAAVLWYGWATGMHTCRGLTTDGAKGAAWRAFTNFA